jgi:hypothetical protein
MSFGGYAELSKKPVQQMFIEVLCFDAKKGEWFSFLPYLGPTMCCLG